MNALDTMTATDRTNQYRATLTDGTTLTVERNANVDEWMVSTFDADARPCHDVMAYGITKSEAVAVAGALLAGASRVAAQDAGKAVANV